jgi:uncharacterized protein (DUF433 family)
VVRHLSIFNRGSRSNLRCPRRVALPPKALPSNRYCRVDRASRPLLKSRILSRHSGLSPHPAIHVLTLLDLDLAPALAEPFPGQEGVEPLAGRQVLSFYELMELFVVAFFRNEGVSMPVVRAARQRAQAMFGTDYPFATEALSTDGRGIFADLPDGKDAAEDRLKVELSKSQVAYRELVEPFFRMKVDYSGGLATTYWPLGRQRPVMLDAHRAFGQPIIQRSGTPTFVLYSMSQSGEQLDRIAAWYEVSHDELNAAIEYEDSLRAAA